MTEQKQAALDPNGKYLIQEGSGAVFVFSEKLAKRKDMRPFDPETGKPEATVSAPTVRDVNLVEIELQGKTFKVEQALHDTLTEMADVMTKLQDANKDMAEEKKGFEAFKERLETDNLDLTEQLKEATEKIKELEDDESEGSTAKGNRKKKDK